mgnify:CR=1 FL=1
MPSFAHRVTARFGDCDPVGILYYPRFFDWFHRAMEAWYGHLGLPYQHLLQERLVGFPSVHAEADYRTPVRFGDTVEVRLTVLEFGRSTIALGFEVWGDGEARARATGRVVTVVMCLDPTSERHMRAIACPDDVRARIERFVEGS